MGSKQQEYLLLLTNKEVTNLKALKTILLVLLSIGLSGCSTLSKPDADLSLNNKKLLDTTLFPHAIIAGKPQPFSALKVGQTPEAAPCKPIWEVYYWPEVYREKSYSGESVKINQDVTLEIIHQSNDFHQTLYEYNYGIKSTGETYQEYYLGKRLIFQGAPQSEYSFHATWIGRNLILFRDSEDFFFLVDIARWTISLFHDSQWKQIPINEDPITDNIRQFYDPAMRVKLGGVEEKSGQVFFYVEHEHTTLFEYNPLWPNIVTVLLDNLPIQEWTHTNYIGRWQLWHRSDGAIWFSVEIGGDPSSSRLVFQYNGKTKVLTPVFNCASDQRCYFHKEAITIHGQGRKIAMFHYNTNYTVETYLN